MPTIPLGVILIWPGTNAAIPAGWIRETSLDGRFPKGSAVPNTTGGSDTHTHTSPSHTHTIANHTHTGNLTRSTNDYETHGGNSPGAASRDSHVHSYTTDSMQGGNLVNAITYAAGSSLPPYYEVVFVKPDTLPANLPDGLIALLAEGDIPTNWDVCDGLNSTPDLVDKYLRGAAAGQDGGGEGGGLTHTHDISHNHGSVVHAHQASEGAVGQSSDGSRDRENFGGGGGVVDRNHKHVAYLNNTSETPSTYSGSAGSAETVEPLHKKLRAIQNNSGGPSKPRGLIGLWLGDLEDIPQGWFLCNGENDTPDMEGYHLKITDDNVVYDPDTAPTGQLLKTGGANTHVHAASNSHTHTAPGSHVHTGSSSHQGQIWGTTASPDGASKDHSHSSLESCSSATSSWGNATVQADSSNNEPAYRTVAFIMFKYETYGGAAILGSTLVN